MIEIFCTSFFYVVDKNAIRYSIANSAPALFKTIPVIGVFVPPFALVSDYKKKFVTWEQYTEMYVDVLREKYGEIVTLLKTLSTEQQVNMEFCCWENKFHPHCHRAIVADVINKTVAFEKIGNIRASVHDLNGVL